MAGREGGQPAAGDQGTRFPPPVGALELRQELSEQGSGLSGAKPLGRNCAQSWEVRMGETWPCPTGLSAMTMF